MPVPAELALAKVLIIVWLVGFFVLMLVVVIKNFLRERRIARVEVWTVHSDEMERESEIPVGEFDNEKFIKAEPGAIPSEDPQHQCIYCWLQGYKREAEKKGLRVIVVENINWAEGGCNVYLHHKNVNPAFFLGCNVDRRSYIQTFFMPEVPQKCTCGEKDALAPHFVLPPETDRQSLEKSLGQQG